jgi:hypothetical protein
MDIETRDKFFVDYIVAAGVGGSMRSHEMEFVRDIESAEVYARAFIAGVEKCGKTVVSFKVRFERDIR